MIESLEKVVECYDLVIRAIQIQDSDSLIGQTPTYSSQILNFFTFQRFMFVELLRI